MRWLAGSAIVGLACGFMFIGSSLVWIAWHLAFFAEWLWD